jgi:hypothetical protein
MRDLCYEDAAEMVFQGGRIPGTGKSHLRCAAAVGATVCESCSHIVAHCAGADEGNGSHLSLLGGDDGAGAVPSGRGTGGVDAVRCAAAARWFL